VRKVETLGAHLCANASLVDIEHEPTKGSICQIEVPHVLKGRFVHKAILLPSAAKRIAAVGHRRHLAH
jgi:hypothetical protein